MSLTEKARGELNTAMALAGVPNRWVEKYRAALDVVDAAASTRKYWSACTWDGGCLPHGPRPRAEAKWCDRCRLKNALAKFKEVSE